MAKLLLTMHAPTVYGAGRMASVFALEAQRIGHEVEIAYSKQLPKGEPNIAEELAAAGMVVHHVPNMAAELSPIGPRPLTLLARERGVDLVASSQQRDAAPAMLAGRRSGAKSLAICMNLPNFRGNPVVQVIKRRMYRSAIRRNAHQVIVVAPAIRDEFVNRYGVPLGKITVVPCAMDLRKIPPRDDSAVAELRREMQIENGSFVAVNLARIHRQKGQDILLQALGHLKQTNRLPPNFRMLFVGGCENDDAEQLLQQHLTMTRELDLESIVNFVGFRQDFRNFLYLADLFVLPSRWEGLPLVLLESFAARVPALMTQYGTPLENFRQGVDGLYVASEDPQALANGIETMIHYSPDHRREIGTNGLQYLEANLTLQHSLGIFARVVNDLLVQ